MTAAALRAWRQSLNLTRREAAALLGCSWQSIAAWEIGRKIPAHRESLIHFITKFREAEAKTA